MCTEQNSVLGVLPDFIGEDGVKRCAFFLFSTFSGTHWLEPSSVATIMRVNVRVTWAKFQFRRCKINPQTQRKRRHTLDVCEEDGGNWNPMEKAVCIDKDPVASTSSMQDHRKRKKDVDMTENEGNLLRRLDWVTNITLYMVSASSRKTIWPAFCLVQQRSGLVRQSQKVLGFAMSLLSCWELC